jgi:hypothetical protein
MPLRWLILSDKEEFPRRAFLARRQRASPRLSIQSTPECHAGFPDPERGEPCRIKTPDLILKQAEIK